MIHQRDFWNERFAREDYFYGTEPNVYLKSLIDSLPENSDILFLGEGEGRNAVYAALAGHNVTALDASEIGLMKTMALADEKGCSLRPVLMDLDFWSPIEQYDAILCSFLHLPEPLRTKTFAKVMKVLNDGGLYGGEFFSIHQLPKSTGGPKDPELLYTANDLEKILTSLPCEILELQETDTELSEGSGHVGLASVVRMKVRKG